MSTHVHVRGPHPADADSIEDILRANGNFSDVEVSAAVDMFRTSLAPDAWYRTLIAECEGRMVGYALFSPIWFTTGTWDLNWIAVHPSAHGSGAGRALLHAVEEAVCKAEGRMIVIETSGRSDYEKARRFYERQGYTLAATLADYYKDGDDKLTYVRRVDRTCSSGEDRASPRTYAPSPKGSP